MQNKPIIDCGSFQDEITSDIEVQQHTIVTSVEFYKNLDSSQTKLHCSVVFEPHPLLPQFPVFLGVIKSACNVYPHTAKVQEKGDPY